MATHFNWFGFRGTFNSPCSPQRRVLIRRHGRVHPNRWITRGSVPQLVCGAVWCCGACLLDTSGRLMNNPATFNCHTTACVRSRTAVFDTPNILYETVVHYPPKERLINGHLKLKLPFPLTKRRILMHLWHSAWLVWPCLPCLTRICCLLCLQQHRLLPGWTSPVS